MSEQQERDFGREPRKPFRRKKKYQGSDWTPPSMSAEVDDGLWCKRCRLRHGYSVLGLKYEKRKTQFVIIWYCKKTGDVLGETPLPARKEGEGVVGTERPGEGRPEATG